MSEVELLAGQRQDGESRVAVLACNDWLRMGSGRSMPRLLEQYQQSATFNNHFQPPTTSPKTLKTWSSRYGWPGRAAEYDAGWEARKNAEREATIGYGLALDYERIRELYRLAAFLRAQIYAQAEDGTFPNVWVPDVKSIGSGENAERDDIVRFNPALVEQYRKVLEDIAKETGGRIERTDLTSGGKPVEVTFNHIPERDQPPD